LRTKRYSFFVLIFIATVYCGHALAEEAKEEFKADGLWHGNVGMSMTLSSGNTRSQSLSLNADAVRKRGFDKWTVYAQALGTRADSNGQTTTTANQWATGARYDHNVSEHLFGFGGLDFSRDQIKLLQLRKVASTGLGYHMRNTPETQWDLFGGVSYRSDRYIDPGVMVRNQLRTKFNSAELMVGEESTHDLSASTTFKQRLAVNRGLNSDGGYRAIFDTSLMVAINSTISLKLSLQDKYDSLAELPIKKNDVVFFTGVNVKFDG